ncbi:Ig-like domain-containing protein [Microcystis aeruginosa]|uniref:Ig-like domain-containing protein n=1 Tax=Microcystis aeruginosa TaxID=1126 RepID=UPI00232EA592|nr:putative Ig domain-containing protein [Microcystis aeruginosa]MDB9391129.1 putative Ig domain-containing protein [Microcystis aeruginosa CS-579]
MATAPSMLAPTRPEVTPLVTPLTLSSPTNFIAPVSAAASDNLANQGDSLLSTPLLVNPEAVNFSFSDQDTSWRGTPQITQLDDLGEVLVVPGNPSERVNMVVQWTVREADFNNEVGFFLVDALGGVEGIAPGEPGFAEAALSSPSRQTLFNSGNQAGNWREFTVAGGSRLGFYLIQNNTSANWLENNRQNQGQSGLAFFSLKGANPDNFDHSQSSHLGRGIWRFNWEDLTGGGDQDFNDVVFNIAQAGIVLPGDKEQQVPLTVEAVSQDNTFPNEMGYYLVDTPDGEINGIKPGDQGYLDAALSGDRRQVIFASGKGFDSKTFNVPSGKYLGWYLVANGTTEQAIAKGENAPPVFFSFAAANEDGLNHVHAQQDSQTWTWEDLWGGGDRDFNDLVFRFSFGEPTGEPIQLPSLSIENTTVTEGNAGTQFANFTVRLSAPATTTVTAQFTTKDGTAQAGTDYESSTGILTFAPGEVEKNIAVAVKGDTISEPTETFTVNLTGVTNAILIQGEGIGTILDNDNSVNPPDNKPPVADADKSITLQQGSLPVGLGINPPVDMDGDPLIISITQLPDSRKGVIRKRDGSLVNLNDTLTIGELTALTYTPLADVNGNGGDFIYTVSDGKGGSDSQIISFVINPSSVINPIQTPVNHSPITDADKTITLPENSKSIPLNINPPTDIDGDSLTATVSQLPDKTKGKITLADATVINVGDEISINSLTSLLYTPLADVNGNGGNFVYTVSDGKGGSDSQTISFIITPENTSGNNSPVTDADKTITLPEDSQPIPLNINPPTDIDGDTLTVSVTQLPDNSKGIITLADGTVINVGDEISIDSLTSLLYTPLADVNGNGGNFVYTVSDGKGGNDSQTISFVINPSNLIVSAVSANNAPEFTTNPELKIIVGNDYSYDANAVDADNDTLFYSLSLAPDGLTIDNNTGVLSWQSPTIGNYNISISVEDGKGGRDTQTYNLGVVTNVIDSQPNRPPVFVSNPVVSGNLNSEYRYDADATDADNDNLTYSVINAPNGLVINQNTGVVTFTPTVSGATEITLQVDDGKGGIATQVYTLSVLEEETDNYAPVIISEPILKASTSQNYVYDVNAIDPDKDNLTYSLVDAPQGMSIDNLTGEILWNTAGKTVGNYDISVKVTDNRGGVDTQEFVIALNNALLGTIEGVKWEDANGNGIWDSANFEDFVDISSMRLNGDSKIVNSEIASNKDVLRLAESEFYSSGNALLKNPFSFVGENGENLSFSTNFSFSISDSSGLGDEDGEGADGIAFIVSPTDTIGSAGGGIGYAGLNNTVVVELDTFNNGSQDQNNGNHIGINVNGSTTSLVQANIPTRFNNGEIWNVWIDYNGSSQLLEARVSQDSNRPTQATVSATVNIAEILGQNEFFVGFTSATGAGLGNHDILSWTFINNEPALEGITVYVDSNNNGTFDNNESSQITDENGKYQFTGLEAGTYIVREIVTTDYKQTYPGGQPTDSLGDGFADIIIDYFNSGAGTFNEPYGADNDGNGPVLVSVDIILGSDTLGALSLPTGSYVTVGFTDEIIIDKPGNDIFIPEIGFAGEQAEVYVSSNLEDFVLLGIGDGGTTSIFDLASINFTQPVRAIKIVGLDNNGLSPGFDVINVQGLPDSIASPDFYTIKLKAGETVSNINFGNQKIDQPIPNQAPVFTSTASKTAQIGQLLTYQATATDANNDRLTYSLLNQPEGMAVDAETGSLIWQPKQSQIGNNRVVLRVSDGKGGIATQEFFLNTKGINTPPQIISSPNTVTLINNTYSYEVRATDFDNDTLTYSLINPPEGMTINANTGLIAYTPTNLGKQTVEIKVSDGFGGTNTQSYQLQVLSTLDNNLPSITSTPKIIIGAGGLYQYDVEANDPENTAISYNLTVKPNGMTIDTNTGLITWQTQNTTNGDFQVTVTATDADGGIAYQNYYIRVTPNQAPIISSQPLELAQLGVTYKYDVIAKDADNDALTYNLLQAPQGLTIDQFGRIRWQSASQNQGIYPVTIQVSDGRGGITTQTYNLTLSNDDITNPVVELGFNSNLINIGESINFQVRATDNIEVKTLTLTANTTPLTLNPNSPNGQINTATFVGQKAGVYQIIATATDAAGNQDTETIEVRVLDPSDTKAPVVEINKTNLEATQGIIKSPTDIIATITDDNLEFYRVEIAPIEAIDLSNIGENDPDYTLLTKGTQNVTNQQVANLDPRLLANGSYLIKITAFDFSGNGNVQGVILNVTGQNKPGDFSLEYTDLSIPYNWYSH